MKWKQFSRQKRIVNISFSMSEHFSSTAEGITWGLQRNLELSNSVLRYCNATPLTIFISSPRTALCVEGVGEGRVTCSERLRDKLFSSTRDTFIFKNSPSRHESTSSKTMEPRTKLKLQRIMKRPASEMRRVDDEWKTHKKIVYGLTPSDMAKCGICDEDIIRY